MSLIRDITLSDFYRYPPIGADDWRYMHQASRVRALEATLISRAILTDMANAPDFASAAELLSSSEYAISSSATDVRIEQMLLERRTAIRSLFAELMLDEELLQLMRAREDYANMRLAIRRLVTGKPLGLDYSNEGNVPVGEFEEILQQENYERLPAYMQEAVESAVLNYYENKDIRQIDYTIDRMHYQWHIARAEELGDVFCVSYGRIQVDLYNIRTMLRLKAADRDEKEFFFANGFVDVDKFAAGLATPYESLGGLFFATPYYDVIEEGVRYLKQEQSFLKLEQQCDDYLMAFLKTTRQITAGPQPVIAYLLMKEAEIRAVRMVLTGKKNSLSSGLILDRLGHWHG